jgi:hypothetical protein
MATNIDGYIYLIQEREFINLNKPIYKLGKTKELNSKRIQAYPKHSRLLIQLGCFNCDKKERELINTFKEKYVKSEIGNEYFEGNFTSMLDDIFKKCTENLTLLDNKPNDDYDSDDIYTTKFTIIKNLTRSPDDSKYSVINDGEEHKFQGCYEFIHKLIDGKYLFLNTEYDITDKKLIDCLDDHRKRIDIKYFLNNEWVYKLHGKEESYFDFTYEFNNLSTSNKIRLLLANGYLINRNIYASGEEFETNQLKEFEYITVHADIITKHGNIKNINIGAYCIDSELYDSDYLRDLPAAVAYNKDKDYWFINGMERICGTGECMYASELNYTNLINLRKDFSPLHGVENYKKYIQNYKQTIKNLKKSIHPVPIEIPLLQYY